MSNLARGSTRSPERPGWRRHPHEGLRALVLLKADPAAACGFRHEIGRIATSYWGALKTWCSVGGLTVHQFSAIGAARGGPAGRSGARPGVEGTVVLGGDTCIAERPEARTEDRALWTGSVWGQASATIAWQARGRRSGVASRNRETAASSRAGDDPFDASSKLEAADPFSFAIASGE